MPTACRAGGEHRHQVLRPDFPGIHDGPRRHRKQRRGHPAIDFVANGVNGGIQRVAAATDRVEEALNTKAITKVGTVAILPVAQVSLTLVTRAAEGTKRLSARVAGAEATVAPVVAKAKRVVKKTVRRVKARA